ncbi:MAG: cyclic nucleotide-binding domain-containing protein [Proteobacteria bacterium]|nr:cyclic nucleotide-binding domain-containing protein [Pseudomonadota bacterium]
MMSAAAGEVLIAAGQLPTRLSVLLQGELRVTLADGRELARLHDGEIVGELSFLDRHAPVVDVTVATGSRILSVAHDVIEARLARDAAFAARFYRALGVFLASRLRETTGRLGVGADALGNLAPDELDVDDLEDTAVAARRFEFLRRRLNVT